MSQQRRFGCLPDSVDERDYKVSRTTTASPTAVDMSHKIATVYDQGSLGSCTANAIAAAMQFLNHNKQALSRLFIYYNERALEGTVSEDAGAQIRDGIKSVNKMGVCAESLWPYKESAFSIKPPPNAYKKALSDIAVSYRSIDNRNLDLICQQLALGYPIVAGFVVYDSFESDEVARTGIVPMPNKAAGEQEVGRHAVLIVGYDSVSQRFKCLNSWGIGWGQAGFFTIPFKYFTDLTLASDFWQIDKKGSASSSHH